MKTERTKNFLFTVPPEDFLPGGIIIGISKVLLDTVKNEKNIRNAKEKDIRWYIRKRYRGPRRSGPKGSSDCILKDAKWCDVYIDYRKKGP